MKKILLTLLLSLSALYVKAAICMLWFEDVSTLRYVSETNPDRFKEGEKWLGLTITKVWCYDPGDSRLKPSNLSSSIKNKIVKIIFETDPTSYKARNLSSWFSGCSNLKSISGLDVIDTDSVRNMSNMFRDCNSLTDIDLSSFKTSKVSDMYGMFYNCSSLKNIRINSEYFDTSHVTDMSYMFYNCSSLPSLNCRIFNDVSNVRTMHSMFSGCSSLTTLYNVDKFNPTVTEDMSYMFSGCSNLRELDMSSFFTLTAGNIITMEDMFAGCSRLERIDYNNKNVKGVALSHCKTIKGMFSGCSNLTHFDLQAYRGPFSCNMDMSFMFYRCNKLQDVDLSFFDTSNVYDMSYMFSNCSSLKNINFDGEFNTSDVMFMQYMFRGCSSLTYLDLSNFNTIHVYEWTSMFKDCSSLQTIYCNQTWTNLSSSDNMFSGCTNLVGAISYDASKTNVNYANPTTGYFTSSSVKKGDVNCDGDINVFDIVEMVDHIMKNSYVKFADLVADNVIDIFDLVEEVSIVMNQTASNARRRIQANTPFYDDYELKLNNNHNTYTLETNLNEEIIAFQFILELTDGLEIESMSTNNEHKLTYKPVDSNRYIIVCYSDFNIPYNNNENLLNIQLKGDGVAIISKALLETESRKQIYPRTVSSEISTGVFNLPSSQNNTFNIYSVTGNIIRKNATSLEGLPWGTYIVNGKKILKK